MPRHYTPGPLPFLPYTQVALTCEHCGARFLVKLSRSSRSRYCSRPCYWEAKRTRVRRACEQCGALFMAKPFTVKKGAARYCSRPCYAEARMAPSVADRFWPRVDKDGPVPEHRPELGPCWVWTGAGTVEGYGKIMVKGTPKLVTHVAWELTNGPISGGAFLLHACDTPTCCRPEHLFTGSQGDNMRDASKKDRLRQKITDAQRDEIRVLWADGGMGAHEIALRYGVTSARIWQIVRELGLARRGPPPKVSPEQRVRIRVRYAGGGVRQADLAREYGVTQGLISQIVRGRR